MKHNIEIKKNLLDIEHGRNFNLFLTFFVAGLSFIGIFVTLLTAFPSNTLLAFMIFPVIEMFFILAIRFKNKSDNIMNQIRQLA